MASEYTNTIGTVTNGGKVHLAHGTDRQRILCVFAYPEYTTHTIATGFDNLDTVDILLRAEVKTSKLCKNCFGVRLRARYQARIRQAIAEIDAAKA